MLKCIRKCEIIYTINTKHIKDQYGDPTSTLVSNLKCCLDVLGSGKIRNCCKKGLQGSSLQITYWLRTDYPDAPSQQQFLGLAILLVFVI